MTPPGLSYKLRRLPAKIRAELDRRLVEGNFTDYRGLAKWLSEQGCEISFAAVHKYGQKLEQRLELLRIATAQAKAVVEAAPEEDRINDALMRLVQQNLFAVLVELEPNEMSGPNLASIARSVANLGRAAVLQRKFALEAAAAKGAATADAQAGGETPAAGGLTAAAEAEIKRALLQLAE
jgi:hypothetical protein